jgi:hypothetical protein
MLFLFGRGGLLVDEFRVKLSSPPFQNGNGPFAAVLVFIRWANLQAGVMRWAVIFLARYAHGFGPGSCLPG